MELRLWCSGRDSKDLAGRPQHVHCTNVSYEARSSADNPFPTALAYGTETRVERRSVVNSSYDKDVHVNKGSISSRKASGRWCEQAQLVVTVLTLAVNVRSNKGKRPIMVMSCFKPHLQQT